MTKAEYRGKWDSAMLLPGSSDLVQSALRELEGYFPTLIRETILRRFNNATRLFAELWKKTVRRPLREPDLVNFYNSTDLEIFELMNYHSLHRDEGPLNYVCALDLAQRLGLRKYLDYGSGTGSGGLLFAREDLDVTLCDVSSPLLGFAKYRFERRGLRARFVDLKRSEPETPLELITCFEVLEHVIDPLAVLRKCHKWLCDGGYLVLTAPFGIDPERPMHVVHDPRLKLKFRAQGFELRKDLKAFVRNRCHEPFFALQKVERTLLGNIFCAFQDHYSTR